MARDELYFPCIRCLRRDIDFDHRAAKFALCWECGDQLRRELGAIQMGQIERAAAGVDGLTLAELIAWGESVRHSGMAVG